MKNKIISFLKILSWLIIFWIGQLFIILFIGIIYSLFKDSSNASEFINNNSYLVMILNLLVFYPIFYKEYKKYKDKYNSKSNNTLKIIIFGILISFILNTIIYLIKKSMNINMTFSFSIWTILNTGIIGPILEEYLFRGIIFNKTKEITSSKNALILTTILFSIIHINIFNIIYALIMGYILNKIYIKENNLKYSILFHITINLVGSFIFPLFITFTL
jgi:hypothetical protein